MRYPGSAFKLYLPYAPVPCGRTEEEVFLLTTEFPRSLLGNSHTRTSGGQPYSELGRVSCVISTQNWRPHHVGIFSWQVTRPKSFVLEKQFMEKAEKGRKLIGTPISFFQWSGQGQFPGHYDSPKHTFRKSKARTERQPNTQESK